VSLERELTVNRGADDSRWLTVFLFLAAVLASTIVLKIGPVQYLEILYFVELAILLVILSQNGYKFRWARPYQRIAVWYLVFCSIAFVFSVSALRYDFYFPPDLGVLNYPVIITISRIVELLASVSIMLYLASIFRRDRSKVAFTMRVYFWVGVISAIYSVVTFPVNLASKVDLGTYGPAHRMRGFYNEGGPYGLYLISAFLVGFALYKYGWVKRGRLRIGLIVMSIAFLGSQSKAAIFAVLLILLINGLLTQSFAKRTLLIASIFLFLGAVYQVVDVGTALRIYQRGSQAYERLSHRHSKDPNFIYGRVAGAFIVPKMVEQHPLVGIGWGNYGLLRNAPEYRGAAVFAEIDDDPGLGIAGMSADLGLPLTFYLVICLFLPFIYLRKWKAPAYLTNLALLQPLVHLFGAQLNVTYPWIVTAFALGLGYSYKEGIQSQELASPVPRQVAS